MKPSYFLIAGLMAAMPLAKAAVQSPKAPANQRAEVVFVAPEKFTDVRDSYTGTDSGRDAILDQLREYIEERADKLIPPGDHLLVSITDVDLAGDFEPWRGPNWADVRIVKDIYPPRINLSFRVTDAAGRVIKEGVRNLSDTAFLMNMTVQFRDDPLRHEKTLLDDWMQREFRELKR
jgi:hypothetical protein